MCGVALGLAEGFRRSSSLRDLHSLPTGTGEGVRRPAALFACWAAEWAFWQGASRLPLLATLTPDHPAVSAALARLQRPSSP